MKPVENPADKSFTAQIFWNKIIRFFDFIFDYLSLHFTVIFVCLLPLIIFWLDNGQIKEIVMVLMNDIPKLTGINKFLFFAATIYFFGFFFIYVLLHGLVVIGIRRNQVDDADEQGHKLFHFAAKFQPFLILLFLLGCILWLSMEINWMSILVISILACCAAMVIFYYYSNLFPLAKDFWKYLTTNKGVWGKSNNAFIYNRISDYTLLFILTFLLFYSFFENYLNILLLVFVAIPGVLAILAIFIKKIPFEDFFGNFLLMLIILAMLYSSPPTMFLIASLLFITIIIFKLQRISLQHKIQGYFFLLLWILIAAGLRTIVASSGLWTAGNVIESLSANIEIENRENIEENYSNWLRSKSISGSIKDTSLVYIISSEGGGIRSAILTNGILSRLDSMLPNVIEKTYAISGVSGGSVGASVFCALKKDGLDSLQHKNQEIFSGDLLSNTILSTLIGFPVQMILPFPVKAFDRSRVLEKDLAKIYKSVTGRKTLEEGVFDLYQDRNYSIPNLFLNTTQVESGKNCIVSNLKLGAYFPNDLDLLNVMNADIPLNTSAIMSARFPIVSSSGLVYTPNGKEWGNLVDGGFYDNSGLLTTIDIVKMIRANTPDSMYIKPVIIFLQNGNSAAQEEGNKGFAPVNSMLNSWSANTERRIKDLKDIQSLFDYELVEFQLDHNTKRDGLSYPLGWLYSDQTVEDLVKAVQQIGVSNDTPIQKANMEAFEKLKSLEAQYQ